MTNTNDARPSPAPTVSVEECAQAFCLARNAHESSDDPDAHGIAAVHSLCVSRLTGAATRSETIEECAKVCDDYEASLHAIGGASMVGAIHCAQRIRSLASHPASEAGEARLTHVEWSPTPPNDGKFHYILTPHSERYSIRCCGVTVEAFDMDGRSVPFEQDKPMDGYSYGPVVPTPEEAVRLGELYERGAK